MRHDTSEQDLERLRAKLNSDVDTHWDYLGDHLDRPTIDAYLDAGVDTVAYLVPLHQTGCTPERLASFGDLGCTVGRAVEFARKRWTPDHLAATDLDPELVLGYLFVGIDDPRLMRRFHAAGAGPTGLHSATATQRNIGGRRPKGTPPATVIDIIRAHKPFDDTQLDVEGMSGPIAFEFKDARLRCTDPDLLETERIWAILGGTTVSPAIKFWDQWHLGLAGDWELIAERLGRPRNDWPTVQLKWLATLIAAPLTPD
ncbi:MAG: hypothetical protein H0U29_03160, partial [Acidimicrobiia bacterium]|nr:hypothetical protein [Acidimicrobiia bacterium]